MKNFIRLWIECVKLNIAVWVEYRADFVIGIVAMLLTNLISVVFFWTIFQHVVEINGWSFAHILFLLGFSALAFGIWHLFLIGASPWRVEDLVRRGLFDRFLLKPMSPLVYLLITQIDDDAFGDIIAGIVITSVASNMLGIVWEFQKIFLFLLLMAGAVLVVFSTTLILSGLSFLVVRSRALADLFFHLFRFTEYPLEIYNPVIIFILTFVLPFGFVNYYPSQIFIGKGMWMQAAYLTPLVGLTMLAIAYAVWKFGLKHYASTGS